MDDGEELVAFLGIGRHRVHCFKDLQVFLVPRHQPVEHEPADSVGLVVNLAFEIECDRLRVRFEHLDILAGLGQCDHDEPVFTTGTVTECPEQVFYPVSYDTAIDCRCDVFDCYHDVKLSYSSVNRICVVLNGITKPPEWVPILASTRVGFLLLVNRRAIKPAGAFLNRSFSFGMKM